ncbi:MAG TPA: outer membrane beta-barrel protein [Candidatus Acidoferrales bacterium]|nr:outer membrane beta-barrel protein [Candidatus Acidoferrales bacterium]
MKKLAGLFGLLVLFVVPAMAQDTTPPQSAPAPAPEEPVKAKRTYVTPKYELSGGYTFRQYYVATNTNIGMNGWYASGDYNWKRWLGFEGEVVGVSKNQGLVNGTTSIYTFMGGVRLNPLGHRKVTPYGHVLYGEGYYRDVVPPCCGHGGATPTDLASTWEVGGGLDYNLGRHLGIRLVEADFGGTKFSNNGYSSQSSRRVSFGIVFRFGEK